MKNETRLSHAEDRVLKASAELSMCLQELSTLASELSGEQMQADLCGGGEIEYRHMLPDGASDAMDVIYPEDLREMIKENEECENH